MYCRRYDGELVLKPAISLESIMLGGYSRTTPLQQVRAFFEGPFVRRTCCRGACIPFPVNRDPCYDHRILLIMNFNWYIKGAQGTNGIYGQGDHVVRGTFFLQRLGVTRASDPTCCLGSQAFVLL